MFIHFVRRKQFSNVANLTVYARSRLRHVRAWTDAFQHGRRLESDDAREEGKSSKSCPATLSQEKKKDVDANRRRQRRYRHAWLAFVGTRFWRLLIGVI